MFMSVKVHMERITPTGKNPISQVVHEMSILTVCLMKSSANRFGASPVINIELVMQVTASDVHIMYAPNLRAVFPGAEPYISGILRIKG